jgi:hypothetical protein
MSVITKKNHQLKGVTQSDVKFVRMCVYDNSKFANRINLSVKFESNSPYSKFHDKDGFVKLQFAPTQNHYTLVRESHHPDWSGLPDMREYVRSELECPDMSFVLCGKGRYVGKKGKNITPEPAYYTTMALSAMKIKNAECLLGKIKIYDFNYELELIETPDDAYFNYIGQEEVYHE